MYTDQSIDDVIAHTDLVEAIGKHVELKKHGSGYKGLSPFTAEKSPSFTVTPSKGMWKCFSQGHGGGGRTAVTKFLELHLGWNWITSIEWMAELSGVTLEKQIETPEQKRHKADLPEMEKVLIAAFRKWTEQLKKDWDAKGPVMQYLSERGYTLDECMKWGMGYAPNQNDFITRPAIDNGVWKYAEMAGLIATKDERNYDTMRDRIIFSIRNHNGAAIGFGGRVTPTNTSHAKYINTKATPLFNKSRELYGWAEAEPSIREMGYVLLMEGYTDVHTCHRHEWTNAVGSLGTAITPQHAKRIKRTTDTVVIVGDGDVAGYNMFLKSIHILLKEELEVHLALMPADKDLAKHVAWLAAKNKKLAKPLFDAFGEDGITDNEDVRNWIFTHQKEWTRLLAKWPEKKDKLILGADPDEVINRSPDLFQDIIEQEVDGVLHWCMAEFRWLDDNPVAQGQAVENVGAFLAGIPSSSVADAYVGAVTRAIKWIGKTKLAQVVKQYRDIKEVVRDDKSTFSKKLPDGVDRDFVDNYGFYFISSGPQTGYWFLVGEAKIQVSNFIIEPIFHKKDDMDDARIIKIKNNRGFENIVMMPSDAVVGKDQFLKWCFRYGGYLWTGSTPQLHAVIGSIMHHMPVAVELKILGQQEEGFFAYQNYILNGKGISKYDAYGLVEHKDKHYFSPGVSLLNKGKRTDDDPYRYDKYLRWMESPVSFETWAQKMKTVYQAYGMAAIAFAFISGMRDIIFDVDNNCPFLYIYGPSQSGKSKIAESVMAVFFHKRKMFQINTGTEFAFFAYLERARNTPAGFNEFDDKNMRGQKESWFQAIKGAYDGEGRMKGQLNKGTGRIGMTVQEVNSALMLVGQYLSTRDDNSVPSRSIVLTYFKRDFTRKEVEEYSELKAWEDEGITSLSGEIVKHREVVKESYRRVFFEEMNLLVKELNKRDERFNERVLRNYTSMVALWNIYEKIHKLPWTLAECRQWCADEIVQMSTMISATDILQEFWAMIEVLQIRGQIHTDLHFKFKRNVAEQRDEDGIELITGNEPMDLLFIRPKLIFAEYSDGMRNQPGDAMNRSSLLTYLKQRDYYMGQVTKEYFGTGADGKRTQTSAIVLDWNALKAACDITLGEKVEMEGDGNTDTVVIAEEEKVLAFGDDKNVLPF